MNDAGELVGSELVGAGRSVSQIFDPARLAAVAATRILDTGPEEAFDRLARLAGSLLAVPFAFVTVVDNSRSFWKSCIGTGLTEIAERQNSVSDSFCQYVIETDEPLIVGDTRRNDMTRTNPSIESMNVLAWAGFPLRSTEGHVLGTFCVVDTVTRDWTDREIDILSSLAAAVEGEMRLRTSLDAAASAGRLLVHEMEVRERLAVLARELVAAHTTDTVAAAITSFGGPVLGAEFASVALLDADRRSLLIRAPDSLDQRIREKYFTVALSDATPLSDAVRRVEPVLLRDHADHLPRYEHLIADASRTGLTATAAMPLVRSDGTVVGALGVGWARPSVFTASEMALLETVASMCAQAIERAQLGDMRAELVKTLQRQLLPVVPAIAGLDIAVRYVAAAYGLGFGGDWYDVIALPDGRAAVVIGDIVGHGIEAAARMAQVRGAINALTRLHVDDLPAVFDEAELMLGSPDDVFIATLAVFVLDLAHDGLTYVSAGHPPAIAQAPDGAAVLLEGGRRPILGQGGARPTVGHATFGAGSMLTAFTDGLVERRRESLDQRTQQLCDLLVDTAVGGAVPVDAVADSIVEVMLGDVANDDVALILVRRV